MALSTEYTEVDLVALHLVSFKDNWNQTYLLIRFKIQLTTRLKELNVGCNEWKY